MVVRIDVLETRQTIEGIADEWQDLWVGAGAATPYNHPLWLLTWLDRFGARGEPYVLTFRRGDRLVAVVPLRRAWLVPAVRAKPVLLGLGTELADSGDPLIADEEAAIAVAGHLGELAHDEPLPIVLSNQTATTTLVTCLMSYERTRLVELSSSVRLGIRFADFTEPDKAIAKIAKRRDVPRCGRRLAEGHEVAFHLGPPDRPSFERLQSLHAERADERAEQGLFATEGARAFAARAIDALGELDIARLNAISADGTPIALELGYFVGERYVGHKFVIDRKWGRYGPGHQLLHQLCLRMLVDGTTEFTMGRGDADYKRHWCNFEQPVKSFAVLPARGNLEAQQLRVRAVLSRDSRRLR